jgi:hypothetical protein
MPILDTLGIVIYQIFSRLGKLAGFGSKVGVSGGGALIRKLSFRGVLTIMFLSVFLVNAVWLSVQERSFEPLAETFFGTLVGADQNVYNEVDRIKEIPNPTGSQLWWSFFLIIGSGWLIYQWYIIIIWLLERIPPFNRSEPSIILLFWASLIFILANFVYNVAFNKMPISLKFDFWLQMLPFRGVIHFARNIGIYTVPFVEWINGLR